MKLLIIGGVAGGASAAARARRLDETAEIVMFERGEFISFANCGLPYHLGEVISDRSSLLVMTPEKFRSRTKVDVRTRQEVVGINRAEKTITVKKLNSGESYDESYDKLILAPGASPIRPPIPGTDDPNVFQFWTIPDMDRIISRIDEGARHAVVVGGGFVGLEVAENLRERGLDVALVEMLPQVLPTLDREMSQPLAAALRDNGIDLRLAQKVTEIKRNSIDSEACSHLQVQLDGGDEIETDFVVMSIGVRPNSELAAAADLELSDQQGIVVDQHLRTTDPDIYAVGDAISVKDLVTGKPAQIPLAGPANRQGRIAAANALGEDMTYKGSLGTSVVKVFEQTAAGTGRTERWLHDAGESYHRIYVHPFAIAKYYPGTDQIAMKLLFNDDGRILGVQAVGTKDIEKRVDVIATAMLAGMTVHDLAELELSYAPPYGNAKDPVNYAGMVAQNVLSGKTDQTFPDEIPQDAFLLDVRQPEENELGAVPGTHLIPLGKLRDRLDELPKDKSICVYCQVGLRGYLAERILKQHGFTATNLAGGWKTYRMFHSEEPTTETKDERPPESTSTENKSAENPASPIRELDVSAMQCPGPVVRLRQEFADLDTGTVIAVKAAPSFAADLKAWARASSNEVLESKVENGLLKAQIRKGESSPNESCCSGSGKPAATSDSAAIVVFSNDLDKVMAAFIIATGLAALGCKVSMFFTFWGLNVLRKERAPSVLKDFLSRMFGFMMPRGARKLALSKMHMAGMGTAMMKHVMTKKNVASLPELISRSRELGVKFIACDMAMNVMGLQREELLEDVDDVAGVAAFAGLAKDSGTTLFI